MLKDERMARYGAKPFDIRYRLSGLSLIELLVTIAVAALLFAIAVPGLTNMMTRNELAVASNAAHGALMVARESAVMRGQPVSLCAGSPDRGCTGDWAGGQGIVFRDANHSGDRDSAETVLHHGRVPGAGQRVSVDGNGPLRSALVYMPLGHAERPSGAFGAGRLRLCVEGDVSPNARELIVSASGRVRAQRVDFGGVCPPL